jgi:TonB family protein
MLIVIAFDLTGALAAEAISVDQPPQSSVTNSSSPRHEDARTREEQARDEALRKHEERRQEEAQREQEQRVEREAEARRAAILKEQQELAAEANERAQAGAKRREAEQAEAARAKELLGWKERIGTRIRSKVMIPLTIIPGGEVLALKLKKSSGYRAYDEAVQRAIYAAAPLPVPSDPTLFQHLRELNLVFIPGGPSVHAAPIQHPTAPVYPPPTISPPTPVPVRRPGPSRDPIPPQYVAQVPSRPPVAAYPPAPPARVQRRQVEEVDSGALDRFALEIQKRVGRMVNERGERMYPRLARERKWEGTTQVAVEYFANGKLNRVTVATSSGYAVLDQKAVEMVQEVLPVVPRELHAKNFTVRLPILFVLTDQEPTEASVPLAFSRAPEHDSSVARQQDPLKETPPKTPQQIARLAFDSTVLLVMQDANGQPKGLGSGFVVREGQIVTNWHVLEGAAGGYVRLVGDKSNVMIEGVLAVSQRADLALIKIGPALGTPVHLRDSSKVAVGDPVFAAGNPQGLEGTFSEGLVSSVRQLEGDTLLQITAPISPGSSGGPVFNERGEVIGVAVGTYKGGQNLNFAIPSSYLLTLLKQPFALRPLASFATTEKPITSAFGTRSVEGVTAGSHLWTYTSNSGAYSFSIRNATQDHIKNVRCLVLFLNSQGELLEADMVTYNDIVPAQLAKRVTNDVHASVQRLSANVVFRVLDFELVK